MLMVELVSGQTPFQAASTIQTYEKIKQCKPTYNYHVNQNLRSLLSQIFVPDPEMRIGIDDIKESKVFKVSQVERANQM